MNYQQNQNNEQDCPIKHKNRIKALVAKFKMTLLSKETLKKQEQPRNSLIQARQRNQTKKNFTQKAKKQDQSQHTKEKKDIQNETKSAINSDCIDDKISQSQIQQSQSQLKKFPSVLSIWKKRQLAHKIIKGKVKIPMEISYYNIGRLKPRNKLNDNVVNSYAFLIQEVLDRNDEDNQIRILDSWVSTTLYDFSKSKNAISRALMRLKVSNYKQVLIVIVNINGHWLFLQIHNMKIYIYDSMVKPENIYHQTYEIKALKQTFDWAFMVNHNFQVIRNYPQQTNTFDCGVMMLLGIIDVAKHSFSWSFSQEKVSHWRIKIANQLLNQEIQDF